MLLQLSRDENVVQSMIYHKTPPSQLLADKWCLRSENGILVELLMPVLPAYAS